MKKSLLKARLRTESRQFVPDLKAQVLSQIPSSQAQRKPRFRLNIKQAWSFSLAVVLIIITGIAYFGLRGINHQTFENSYISVDINPSIELEADGNDLVVSYRSMNIDAQLLLEEDGLNLNGKTIDEAIELIVDLAIEYGYLDVDNPEAAVLVTAINRDTTFEEELNLRLKTKMTALAVKKNLQGEVLLAQADEGMKAEAKAMKVSVGKMILINRARTQHPDLSVSVAAKLPVKELNEMAKNYNQTKITKFTNDYEQKLANLTSQKEAVLKQMQSKKATIIETIDEILIMIDNKEPIWTIKTAVDELLATYYPHVKPKNLITYSNYEVFLTNLRDFTEAQVERMGNLVETKYDSQVKAFRFQMQGRLGDELIDFEFVFDNDFKLEEFTDGELSIYNETEERILEIINQISTFISVIDMNPGKQHGRSDRVIS
ncbi:MAG TPA: hypothetical protein PK087_02930, partial [Bacilli bacterium]|nr:hypothetical protein [Bacilli bacterium]